MVIGRKLLIYFGVKMTTPKPLLTDYKKPEDLIGEHGLLKQLTEALVERALQAD